MQMQDVKEGINEYCRSRFSVADDDRLRQHVKNIPGNIMLDVTAIDTDSIGDPCDVHMSVEKIMSDSWEVRDHWAFESGCRINDAMIAHSLIYILRCRRVRVKYDFGSLKYLESIGYNLDRIVGFVSFLGGEPTLNNAVLSILIKGITELEDYIAGRLRELTDKEKLDAGERNTLIDLLKLDVANDLKLCCDNQNSHLRFVQNREIYEKNLKSEIASVERNMGFPFK